MKTFLLIWYISPNAATTDEDDYGLAKSSATPSISKPTIPKQAVSGGVTAIHMGDIITG